MSIKFPRHLYRNPDGTYFRLVELSLVCLWHFGIASSGRGFCIKAERPQL